MISITFWLHDWWDQGLLLVKGSICLLCIIGQLSGRTGCHIKNAIISNSRPEYELIPSYKRTKTTKMMRKFKIFLKLLFRYVRITAYFDNHSLYCDFGIIWNTETQVLCLLLDWHFEWVENWAKLVGYKICPFKLTELWIKCLFQFHTKFGLYQVFLSITYWTWLVSMVIYS